MRILFAIGCNEYDDTAHFCALGGAEIDAKSIFKALTRPDIGKYDSHHSRLLLSPTVDQVRAAFREIFRSTPKIDVLTFFFAGHGGLRSASFYMCMKDTEAPAMGLTAYPLSELFRVLNDQGVSQSNIIIDACQSGALIHDLGALLKPEIIGNAATPSVTLLAMAAQDQYAGETSAGGAGTVALLECVTGKEFVQDSSPMLDLVEIGRKISDRFAGTDQVPVVWGLNLYGAPTFCRNVRFASDPAFEFKSRLHSNGSLKEALGGSYADLWSVYDAVSGEAWDLAELRTVVATALKRVRAVEAPLVGPLAESVASSLIQRAAECADRYRPVQVAATMAVLMLPYSDDEATAQAMSRLLQLVRTLLHSSQSELLTSFATEDLPLLSKTRGSGVADFFCLPLRISKVLGWAAWLVLVNTDQIQRQATEQQFASLWNHIITEMPNNLAVVSERQTPCIALTLKAMTLMGMTEEAELLFGYYFNSLVSSQGRVARHDIKPERILELLISKAAGDFSLEELYEQPHECLTVLLRFAKDNELGDAIDRSLWKLDHTPFLAYVPKDTKTLGMARMAGGQNHLWTVGRDLFKVEDFDEEWLSSCPRPSNADEYACAALSSLVFEDRVAWTA